MDWENRAVSVLLCLSILLATIHNGNAERKIVCYYTNWSIYRQGTAKFSPQNINPYLCTHLIYAFGGFTKDNALKPFDKYQDIEKGGYAKFTGLKTYNKNLKTMLAIGGWNEGSSRFSPMVADPDRRREFVKNAIKFLRKNHFDGLDLDWEYPAFRDGGKPRDKDNYANLVQELREEFERESSKTGRPRLLLTLAMPAGIEYIDKGYDVPRLNEYLDFINLLSYDYHSAYEPAVNHHSPLYPLEEDNEYNYDSELTIDYTVTHLLKKGATSEKIILGIPTYGRSYTLFNQDATDLGSPADGPGIEGDATREKGYLAYYEICDSVTQSDDWEVIQPNPKAMGPYAFKEDQWVGYDDENIVKLKAKYAKEKDLGGIMFWSIDNDDFRGKCHDRPYPLIEAAKETLLTTETTNTVQKTRPVDARKKPRIHGLQSNAIGRKTASNGRRSTTTAAPVFKQRASSSRPKYRILSRPKVNDEEEEEEEEEQEVDRRSYDQSSDEEDNDGGNAVRTAEKRERSSGKNKSRPKNRSSSNRNRRKQTRRKVEAKNESREEQLSNKLTTPEPPTTPDPGTDFKCEDEGFFPHPRDCKKYFWCLESGPGGLGVVAHQFTCPSGLVFNKAADSCDYPRNVVCPKSKGAESTGSTTKAPIVAATSRTTYLYSTTRKPSTEKPDSEEEYEYYDEEEEEEEEKEMEEEEKPKTTTTPKPLLYKTITRNRPTTSTTTEAPSTTSKGEKSEAEKVLDLEDEEDPKVIKELIKLIKKAGGIEELEKQLLLQDKNSPDTRDPGGESATPATISRTLYERVLNRQANKSANRQGASTNTNFANGPGRAQFEGLDEVPEVKSLRRSQKPQYVTIERPRATTKQPPVEEEEASEEEDLDEDNADVASSEEQTVSNPFLTSSTQRATPNYFNIRRTRPSASRNENDVEEKTKDADEETPVRRRRPSVSSKNTETSSTEDKELESTSEENSQTTKSRYVSVQRFRSTTPQPAEVVSEAASSSQPPVTESTVSTVSTEATKIEQKETPTTPSIIVLPSVGVSSTPNDILIDSETEKPISSSTEAISTTESVRLVEDSATEILLTTAPASLSTLPAPNTRISTASVSQPRPFGFNRRNRPSSEPTTTPLPASNDQTRSKVASSEVNRLPTLKELIGYRTNNYDNPSPVFLSLFPLKPKDEEILSRENAISNDTQPWTHYRRKQEKTYDALSKHLDLSADAVNAYYVEDNAADEEDDSSLTKKRIDRQDSSTTTLKPTTMRGIPLINLLQSKPPRGFYVTRSETTVSAVQQVESEGVTTETTIVLPTEDDQNGSSTVASETEPSQTERNNAEESAETSTEFGMALNSSLHANSGETEARVEGTTSMDEEQTQSLTTGETITDTSTSEENVTASPSTVSPINSTPAIFASPFPIESETSPIPESVDSTAKEIVVNDNATLSVSNADSTLISTVTEAELRSEDETSTAYYPAADRNVTDKESKSGESSSSATISSTLAAELTEPTVTERNNKERKNKDTRGRPKVEFDSGYGYEFGRKSEGRRRVGLRVTPTIAEGEDAKTETDKTQQTRRRVAVYRGRRRKPAATTSPLNSIVYQTTRANNREVAEESAQESEQRTTTVSLGETATEREMNESEGSAEEKKVARKSNEARNEADSKEEDRLRIEENVDRFETEVNTSKSTVTSRNPGNLPSTRLRKPTTLASTAPQNKTANTLANHRKTHPGDGNFTLVNEKPDAADEITETRKAEKDIDQSSRAQEIAVTLAEAPSSRTSATGRPPLRNALRRKISTTIAPRTDPTTSRTTVRFTPPVRSRQRPKAKDKAVQNATTRPRRPPVVDYDYYEDEEEPVVGKSSFNGKLFLTSKGNIRCLDQGNFPHPYSCKKFITCAKMVNGLVIGAEYTCPDKLSYDPVGGICNWSAGLGCKE